MMNSIRTSRRTTVLGSLATMAAALLVTGVAGAAPTPSNQPSQTYRITIKNLLQSGATTPSQPLSSALVVVHDRNVDLFTEGDVAGPAVVAVAENGYTEVGITALTGTEGVHTVTAEGSTLLPGASTSFEVTVSGNDRLLSFVSRLVNTNDGFVGLDAIRLTGGTKTYSLYALDAGSEVNDQLTASITTPDAGTAESLKIRRHEGIVANVGDFDAANRMWPVNEPIALVTIERVR